ncbi:unnamed protein product [Cylicostephanus goldi]|uniref:Beta-lactamase-related domain-containing protein n=1 Tax=Cylicostephanus goldi TaxID=71465 RepID=A0A3P6R5N7_CYLGO|nr:unnamed protein product [Cylicostephanus goldi]
MKGLFSGTWAFYATQHSWVLLRSSLTMVWICFIRSILFILAGRWIASMKAYGKPLSESGVVSDVCKIIVLLALKFRQNFIDGLETEGASFAVYVKGQKVVDLWGGYADLQAARTWKEDTMSVVFSTTKAVAALCIAVLADRGRLRYDDLVSKHWPGFAKNGKDNITIEWVMSHMAGLYYFEEPITKEIATNHDLMKKLIENETPKFPPGTAFGYHAMNYGWLVDQIIRHTDEKKRGIGQFLREEITGPNGRKLVC